MIADAHPLPVSCGEVVSRCYGMDWNGMQIKKRGYYGGYYDNLPLVLTLSKLDIQ